MFKLALPVKNVQFCYHEAISLSVMMFNIHVCISNHHVWKHTALLLISKHNHVWKHTALLLAGLGLWVISYC